MTVREMAVRKAVRLAMSRVLRWVQAMVQKSALWELLSVEPLAKELVRQLER